MTDRLTGSDISEIIRRAKQNFGSKHSPGDKKSSSNIFINQEEIIDEITKYKTENQMEWTKKIGFDF